MNTSVRDDAREIRAGASGGASRPCCWCGASTWHLTFRTRQYALLRCDQCGGYSIDPPPIQDDADAADFYTDYYRTSRGRGTAASARAPTRLSRFWQVVARVPSLQTVRRVAVDFGCGDGGLCGELKDMGWPTVHGLDVSKSRIARARQSYPEIAFHDAPLDEAELGRHSSDLIVMDNVIEHLPEPAGPVRQLREYLAPDGKLVVITPNMESGNFKLLGRRWTPELAPHAHIFLFTPRALTRLLEHAGYRIESTGSFAAPPFSFSQLAGAFRRGVKEPVWRAVQDFATLYGRVIGAGAMLYAVATPACDAHPTAP